MEHKVTQQRKSWLSCFIKQHFDQAPFKHPLPLLYIFLYIASDLEKYIY